MLLSVEQSVAHQARPGINRGSLETVTEARVRVAPTSEGSRQARLWQGWLLAAELPFAGRAASRPR
jgi:hypothetical protein